MGYSHGKKWNAEEIEKGIKEVMAIARIKTMPTHALMDAVTGGHGLTMAIVHNGGTKYWANKLGIDVKSCESELGYTQEDECMQFLINSFGYECEKTQIRYPYDLLVNGNIKVDVKCSHLYNGKHGSFYTFNLEKPKPTCDVFVCYCMSQNETKKVYVIPSCIVSGKTQLSIGEVRSKYDKYIDNWDVIERYDAFYKELLQF